VKNLLTELERIHNKLKDKNEIAIVYQYKCVAKRYTIALTGKLIFIDFYNHIFNLIFKLSSKEKSIYHTIYIIHELINTFRAMCIINDTR